MRTAIAHQNLCWIPIVRQETKDSSRKDCSENSNRILPHTPAKNGNKYPGNCHNSPSKPIGAIDPVHCIHHAHHPEPGKETSGYAQQIYLKPNNSTPWNSPSIKGPMIITTATV